MHELGIVFHVIRAVEGIGRELLPRAALKIETLPAVTHCEGCGAEYPTVRHGRICPHCGSEKTWLLRGNEINIKEIEAI